MKMYGKFPHIVNIVFPKSLFLNLGCQKNKGILFFLKLDFTQKIKLGLKKWYSSTLDMLIKVECLRTMHIVVNNVFMTVYWMLYAV
jgi:hypothetical protein